MADPSPTSADDGTERATAGSADKSGENAESTAELRQQVEEEYDFENFGPREMAQMTPEEWEAAFDADSWITGEELLDRVEADLKNQIKEREVFARLERIENGVLAYSDEGYAVVHPDGSVEGEGTVLRDVKPTVALCSMDDYDVADPPEGELLPDPEAIEGGGELGNWMLQTVAAIQFLTGVGLIIAWLFFPIETIFAPVIGLIFLFFSLVLFVQVANARLSNRFRSEEYRNRLRTIGIGSEERPDFLPEEYQKEHSTGERDSDESEPTT
ncbi:MAG TPA: hypothetical protein VFJ06_13545 [Halococcus sp.]|nr:hypothetical protein [Halococcus sp.]